MASQGTSAYTGGTSAPEVEQTSAGRSCGRHEGTAGGMATLLLWPGGHLGSNPSRASAHFQEWQGPAMSPFSGEIHPTLLHD